MKNVVVVAVILLLCGCAGVPRPHPAWGPANRAYEASNRRQSHAEFIRSFVEDFLDGFLHPDAERWSSDPESASYRGYLAGQQHGRVHPEQRHALLLAYGYMLVERVGEYHYGFEVSTFFPEGGGAWWIESLTKWPEMPDPPHYRIAYVRYRLAGYLSPLGQYGHLGMCPRRLLATRIEQVANKALEPTTLLVTPRAEPRVAPSRVVAHLERWAKEDDQR